jgi:type II secretory pathway predicted ATPase ExeA
MQRPGYERFALVSNPFHDLASESLDEIEVYHVLQEADEAFERMKQEVLERSRKAFVLVVGPLGSGKTQRLRVTERQAAAVEAYSQYLNLGEAPPDPVAAIAEGLEDAIAKRKLAKGFSPPKWSKDLSTLAKGKALNPETAGRTLAEALNALAPSYLLLNDLDALHGEPEARFLQTLLAAVSHLREGTMVAIACQQPHFVHLTQRAGPLMSRVNRVLELRGLTNEEAELVLAKRMAGRRLIEDLDPIYPFTRPGLAELNKAANGSPRRLLQLADLVLDSAVKERAFQIGPEIVAAALAKAGGIVEAQPVTPEPTAAVAPRPATVHTPSPSAPALPPPPAGRRAALARLGLQRQQ